MFSSPDPAAHGYLCSAVWHWDFRIAPGAADAGHFMPSLQAGCSIPFVLQTRAAYSGAPPGAYWDGGITDYHLHLQYRQLLDAIENGAKALCRSAYGTKPFNRLAWCCTRISAAGGARMARQIAEVAPQSHIGAGFRGTSGAGPRLGALSPTANCPTGRISCTTAATQQRECWPGRQPPRRAGSLQMSLASGCSAHGCRPCSPCVTTWTRPAWRGIPRPWRHAGWSCGSGRPVRP